MSIFIEIADVVFGPATIHTRCCGSYGFPIRCCGTYGFPIRFPFTFGHTISYLRNDRTSSYMLIVFIFTFQQRTIILTNSMKTIRKKRPRKRKPNGGLEENLMKKRKTNDECADRTQSTFPIAQGTRVTRSINVPSQVDNPSSICVQSQASKTSSTNATFQSSGPSSTNDTSQARRSSRYSRVSGYGQALSINRGNQTRYTGSLRRPSRATLVARCVAAHSPIRGNRAHNRATELTSDATIEIRETP